MKNRLTIGQFSKAVGLSAKALRLYEEKGLLLSHSRGDNAYRYYETSQIARALQIKELKDLGFALMEIKSLLKFDQELASDKMISAMEIRLHLISDQAQQLEEQKNQIEKILASLKRKNEPLEVQQRRAIMSFYGKVLIVVTGQSALEKTAEYIQHHLRTESQFVPIVRWEKDKCLNEERPLILVVPEEDLGQEGIEDIHPDVVVVKEMGSISEETKLNYLKLYSQAGPHMNTVFCADDRASVELAANTTIKKGRIFYYSKNRALEPQIRKIGGVFSCGDEIQIHGFNLRSEVQSLKVDQILTYQDEMALLSSYGAILTLGLKSVLAP